MLLLCLTIPAEDCVDFAAVYRSRLNCQHSSRDTKTSSCTVFFKETSLRKIHAQVPLLWHYSLQRDDKVTHAHEMFKCCHVLKPIKTPISSTLSESSANPRTTTYIPETWSQA